MVTRKGKNFSVLYDGQLRRSSPELRRDSKEELGMFGLDNPSRPRVKASVATAASTAVSDMVYRTVGLRTIHSQSRHLVSELILLDPWKELDPAIALGSDVNAATEFKIAEQDARYIRCS
jgi:hypothetical protein